jgi:hypothetical protein
MSAELTAAARSICLTRYRAIQEVIEALALFDRCDEAICEGLVAFPEDQQDRIVAAMEAQNEFLEEALLANSALNLFAKVTFTDPAALAGQEPQPQTE